MSDDKILSDAIADCMRMIASAAVARAALELKTKQRQPFWTKRWRKSQ